MLKIKIQQTYSREFWFKLVEFECEVSVYSKFSPDFKLGEFQGIFQKGKLSTLWMLKTIQCRTIKTCLFLDWYYHCEYGRNTNCNYIQIVNLSYMYIVHYIVYLVMLSLSMIPWFLYEIRDSWLQFLHSVSQRANW